MRSRIGSLIVLLALASGGCAIKVVDVQNTIPAMEMTEKFPLRAVVLVREPTLALDKITSIPRNCNANPSNFAPFKYGKLFEDASQGIFSQMFSQLNVVHHLSVSKEYDIIMEANLDRISNMPGCGLGLGHGKGFFRAEGSLRILDRDLNVLWESKENAAEDNFDIAVHVFRSDQLSPIVSESISRSVVSLVRGWGQDLKSSLTLYKYAKSLRNLRQSAANPSESSPEAINSDVDDVPSRITRENKNAYAIVIGVEQYRQQLPRAEFAARDAQMVTQYLTKTLGYPDHNVVTLLNEQAAKSDFEKYFEKWLPNNVENGSTVFVYYSGHGAPNPKTSDAYLVPYDGDPSFIDETGYSLKRMYAALGKLPAKEVVVALDTCFSGAGGRSVIAKGSRPLVMNLQSDVVLPKNMAVLSASSGDQTSSTYEKKGHGLFTYFMLKGIKNEDVMRPDGSLKVDDLYVYIKPQVENIARKQYNNEQTPQLIEPKKN